jgi:hypothetical protein
MLLSNMVVVEQRATELLKAVQAASESLREAMISAGVRQLPLNGIVRGLGEDFVCEYSSVGLDADDKLVALDEDGEETLFEDVDLDVEHSLLLLAVHYAPNAKLLGYEKEYTTP